MMKARQFSRLLVVVLMLIGAATNALAQEEYITDVIVLGASIGNGWKVKNEYKAKGWTVVENDINQDTGGWDIYIAYKTDSTANPESGYVTEVCAYNHKVSSFTFEGRTYYKVPTNSSSFDGDVTKGSGGSVGIWLYYTTDRKGLYSTTDPHGGTKRVITKLSVTYKTDDNDPTTSPLLWRNSNYSGYADMNKGTGEKDIFIQQHFAEQTMKWKEEPTFATDLVYNGQVQDLVTSNPWEANQPATLKYQVGNGAWSSGVPVGRAVGNYVVSAYLDPVSTYWIRISGMNYKGTYQFANDSRVIIDTVTIHPPVVKADNLKGVFNQGDKKVLLSWNIPSIPGNYADFRWVVYRDGTKIAELPHGETSYSDAGYTNETAPVYDVYYVSNFWDVNTQRDDAKVSVTVSTTRTVPINNLRVDQEPDRLVFTWTSDAYPEGFGHEFRIYVGDNEDPIYKLTPADMQTSFQWEHRTTDQHNNPQNKIDPETGVPYTEEPLNACNPNDYRIDGVIAGKVLNTYTAKLKAIGEATKFYSLDASKGSYESLVKLSWHVDKQGSPLAKTYIVERRRAEQESEAWETLTRISSNEDYLFYTDETALPGVYYDYRVIVEDKCDDGTILHNELADVGFAKSIGTVTGRIAYGSTGTAVQGVEVEMTMTSSGGEALEQFHSIYFSDMNGAVTWQYPSDDYADGKFGGGDFSVQMWLFPESFSESTIVDFGNGNGLSMTASGGLAFSSVSGDSPAGFDGITLRQNAYNHVALTRSGRVLTCYVVSLSGNSSSLSLQKATLTLADDSLALADAKQFSLGHFKGAVDEFRLWTKCLSEDDIMDNYDRLLVGDEKQLETYWTFDEGLHTQFFDYSRDGTNYRKHHGRIGSNAQASTLTPGTLRLKAKTDAGGNYIIQGIPFSGEGSTYSIIPLYGIHEFKPARALRFVGRNSMVHTADFEDVSSFLMSGYVRYAGTNVPAEGIPLYIDGMPVSKDGKPVMTGSKGEYNISVPIGHHYVEAKLENHKMVDDGRFPTEGTFYFDRAITHDFTDSTLVNFVGRVGGGERNDTLGVGFAESKNNIGIATLRLSLLNESFSLNCQDDHISAATTERTWQSDTTAIQSTARTGIDYDSKYIFIRTDSLSGEFSALLPPLKYVCNLSVDNNQGIDFGSQSEIDLTKVGITFTDSLRHWDASVGDSVTVTYKYNTKKVFTYYAPPEVTITEKGHDAGVYGIQEIVYTDDEGKEYTIGELWKQEGDSVKYLLDYPIYEMGKNVEYDIFAFERYVNHDGDEDVIDIVPLPGQEITIVNEMSDDQKVIYKVEDPSSSYKVGEIYDLKAKDMPLGGDGHLTYQWGVGLPNITEPYTRHFAITMTRKNRVYAPVDLDAVVLGQLSYGSNFVTKGPDHVNFVLRDPQGAKSTTKLKIGKITTKTTFDTRRAYGEYSWLNNILFGMEHEVGTGLGFMTITKHETWDQLDVGVKTSWEKVWNYDEVDVETTTENVSTSGANPYVGAKGDVYVGTAINFLIGGCRHLFIDKNLQTGQYELKLEDAIAVGDSIATAFKYTQYELQNVMIPKWKDMRRTFLTEVASEAEAMAYVNNGEESVYLTWEGLDLDDYEDGKNYRWAKPVSWETTPPPAGAAIDSVGWCNNQIKAWEEAIEANEKDKLELMASTVPENISIDGGSSYSYSKKTSHSENDQTTVNWKMGLVLGNNFGIRNKSLVAVGDIMHINTEDGGGFTRGDGTKTENYTEWEYSIVDGNRDTDLSLNIYKSKKPKYSDFFSVFGGQTYNPYQEQEVTQYYLPGTPLGNSTQQMEQPNLNIAVGDQNPSKNATVTDIPSGGEANVTLYCTNMSNVNQGSNFSYNLLIVEQTNNLGLEILMDGVPVNGRSIQLNQSETTKKVLTIRQTDQSILDYEGIKIRFCSQYQPGKIYDEVTLNAHFVPSSSPINLAISEPVLNIETLDHNQGDLILKVSGFDRQFKGLKKLGVEYRYEGSTVWNRPDTLTFVVNRADSTSLDDHVLPATGDLRLRLNMKDDVSYPQGNYTFRAYTTTQYGTDDINVYSSEVAVVKDNIRPRNLTTPAPTDGILRYGDDIIVEFNEDIVPGYVGDQNIIVTAKLNNQPVAHDVAKQLGSYGNEQVTVNPIFLNGDFSIECWLKWTEAGSILRIGNGHFVAGIDEAGHIVLNIGTTQIACQDVLPKNEWTYLVASYKADAQTMSALAMYGNVTLRLATDYYVGGEMMQEIRYSDDNRLYLGNMNGAIHDLCLFNIYRDVYEAAAMRSQGKDSYNYGLVNYWPMNEGHGTVATDMRHTHDFQVDDTWLIDNVNYAASLGDGKGVEANIATVNTSVGDSYAIELWAHVAEGAAERATIFETGSSDANRLGLYLNAQKDWMLRYGQKEQVVASHEDFIVGGDLQSPTWTHVALNVVRGQTAGFYLNGRRTAVIAETDVPPLLGARLTLGKDMGSSSNIDEVRIWHAALSESRLLSNMYNCIDTAEVSSSGLVAYYPFEKQGTVNGVETMIPTLEDLAPRAAGSDGQTVMLTPLGTYELTEFAPPLKNAPVEKRLIASPVASERKIVVRLEEGADITARDVEGTTLNVTVDKIHDMHGNQSLPIRWQVYCLLNTLKWTKDSVNVIKRYGDDYTFDVDIENRSGRTEYYTLYNMPQWLTLVDSERTDDIAPQKTKTLRFQVNPLVAVGDYDVTIGLQGNNEILEPLRIVMKVRGEQPTWSVDPNAYENMMSVVGQVYVDGVLLGNTESLLAAFIDGECRGVASPIQMRGAAYVPMSIYGTALQTVNGKPADLDNGRNITFRLWDARAGIVYSNVSITLPDGTATENITFNPTVNYGSFDSPLIFTKSNLIEQPLYLKTGWNWLSLGVEPSNALTSAVFEDFTSWQVRLKDHDSGMYYCNGSYWAGPLDEVHANKMYKMMLTPIAGSKDMPQPLNVVGQQVKLAETPVTLEYDWNWMPYTPTVTMTIGEALAGANPQMGDQVKSQTAFAYYGPYGWEGNLLSLESGKGYLYQSKDRVTKSFVYPTVAASQARHLVAATSTAPSVFSPVNPNAYPDNMTMVVLLTNGSTPVADAEIGAFVNGECRGAAVATTNGELPLYYLLIAGEGSGQPIELRAYIGGSTVTLSTDLTYSSDGNIGTPWEPYVIDISEALGITVVDGLSTDTDWYTLQGIYLGTTKPTTPGVYIRCTAKDNWLSKNGRVIVIK